MSRYQHKKGDIKENALQALLHDPLFKQRIEKNKKGKGSYQRKSKHYKEAGGYNTEGITQFISVNSVMPFLLLSA